MNTKISNQYMLTYKTHLRALILSVGSMGVEENGDLE